MKNSIKYRTGGSDLTDKPTITDSLINLVKRAMHFREYRIFYRLWVPTAVLIGISCGLLMVAFEALLNLTTTFFSAFPQFITPLFGGLVSSLFIYKGYTEIQGSGVSKAIEAIHNPEELHARTGLTKLVATVCSIGSGCPVGREGPAILMGGAMGVTLSKHFKQTTQARRRVFLMMGAAACTSAIYKAPLGGALFATEVPFKRDALQIYYIPMIISSIVSYFVFILFYGTQKIFAFEAEMIIEVDLLPKIVLFAFLAGGLGVLFSMVFMVLRKYFRTHIPDQYDPLIGISIASLMIFLTVLIAPAELTIAGLGFSSINYIATNSYPIIILLILMITKLIASGSSVAGSVSGGVMAPALFVGACFGAIFGQFMAPEYIDAFVVLGMGSVLAATTKTPVASTILILELTSTLTMAIPLAISIAIAYLVSGGSTLYESQRLSREEAEFEIGNINAKETVNKNYNKINIKKEENERSKDLN